eukprot:856747-Prymnesium_polylepis.1
MRCTMRCTMRYSAGQPRPLVAGSWPEKQHFSWRRLPFGDAFQPAARAVARWRPRRSLGASE